MKKRNIVNQLTREYIITALITLMKTRDYDKISITDITEKAGVSRMAYYRNFSSKDDILDHFMQQVGEKVHARILSCKSDRDMLLYYYTLFCELGKYADVAVNIYRANLGSMILEHVTKNMQETFPINDGDPYTEYRCFYLAGAFFSVFSRWINTGRKETPADLARICLGMMGKPFSSMHFVAKRKLIRSVRVDDVEKLKAAHAAGYDSFELVSGSLTENPAALFELFAFAGKEGMLAKTDLPFITLPKSMRDLVTCASEQSGVRLAVTVKLPEEIREDGFDPERIEYHYEGEVNRETLEKIREKYKSGTVTIWLPYRSAGGYSDEFVSGCREIGYLGMSGIASAEQEKTAKEYYHVDLYSTDGIL